MALMNRQGRSRRFGLIVVMAMLGLFLGIFPVGQNVAHADTRTVVSSVELTGYVPPVFKGEASRLELSAPSGAVYYNSTHMGNWEKKVGETYQEIGPLETFDNGTTYRYSAQIRIDVATHKFDQSGVTVKVDGATWTVPTDEIKVFETFSFLRAYSPDVTLSGSPSSFTFTDSSTFDIPATQVGTAITPINVSGNVSGGVPPYTFSVSWLPKGLSMSSSGTISGTPALETIASSAWVTVRDNQGEARAIQILTGKMTDPRAPITEASFTGFPIPTLGSGPVEVTLTPADPCYRVHPTYSKGWYKDVDGISVYMTPGDKFEAGKKYSYGFTAYIGDGTGCGATHRFAKPYSLKVDGVDWYTGWALDSPGYPDTTAAMVMNFTMNADGTITTESGVILGEKIQPKPQDPKPDPSKPQDPKPDPSKPRDPKAPKLPAPKPKALPKTGA